MYTILPGHTSEETAYLVEDYPYGFRQRTSIRYWIETKNSQGQRYCHQTLNPKTGQWNKPKYSTYAKIILIGLNSENNHVEPVYFPEHYNVGIEDYNNWYKLYYKFLGVYELKQFELAYAIILSRNLYKSFYEVITVGNLHEYQKAVYLEIPNQLRGIRAVGLDKTVGVE